jgi:hypothetical protein
MATFRRFFNRVMKYDPFQAIASFIYYATHFAGAANSMERVSVGNWTGLSNGKTGICSFWFRTSVTAGTFTVFEDLGQNCLIQQTASNNLRLTIYDSTATTLSIQTHTANGTYCDGNWHHFLFTWDSTSSANCQIYADGVSDCVVAAQVNNTLDYAGPNWSFSSNDSTGITGDISEFYWAFNQWLDITVSANVLAFRTAAGHPANLGPNGSLPTGTSPTIYLNQPYTNFQTNAGTGGNFTTVNGSLASSTTP